MNIVIQSNGMCKIGTSEYPSVGFGTYPLQGQICTHALQHAVEDGYRMIDTATFYRNFAAIAKVLKWHGRQNFYVISKVWPDAQTPQRLRADLKATLEQLQTDYLDAYLVHWPNRSIPIEDTLNAMQELRSKGLVRHIGLSNVTVNHVRRALEVKVPISWVQVEMHPLFYDPLLLKYCQENSIVVQAWAPLARGRLVNDPLLCSIGKKYGKKASQVAIRWILQHGCVPLPSSQNPEHIRQNIDVMDFTLNEEEMNRLDARAKKGKRQRIGLDYNLGFTDEFDYTYEQCWPKNK